MCLGIPGQIVAIDDAARKLATVAVAASAASQHRLHRRRRPPRSPSCVGDWVLVHVGFAMARIDEAEAAETLKILIGARRGAGRARRDARLREEGDVRGSSGRPLSILHGGRQDEVALDAALARSIADKTADGRDTSARFFADEGPALLGAARALAKVCAGGGRLFTMGNGGSSCDRRAYRGRVPPPGHRRPPGACRRSNLTADVAMLSGDRQRSRVRARLCRQLVAHARAGDAVIGVSTSGNAANPQRSLRESQGDAAGDNRSLGGRRGSMRSAGKVDPLPRRASASIHRIRECTSRLITSCGPGAHAARRRARLRRGRGSMKYVDGIPRSRRRPRAPARDRDAGRHARRQPARPIRLMEVCGGHTTRSFATGSRACCPKRSS